MKKNILLLLPLFICLLASTSCGHPASTGIPRADYNKHLLDSMNNIEENVVINGLKIDTNNTTYYKTIDTTIDDKIEKEINSNYTMNLIINKNSYRVKYDRKNNYEEKSKGFNSKYKETIKFDFYGEIDLNELNLVLNFNKKVGNNTYNYKYKSTRKLNGYDLDKFSKTLGQKYSKYSFNILDSLYNLETSYSTVGYGGELTKKETYSINYEFYDEDNKSNAIDKTDQEFYFDNSLYNGRDEKITYRNFTKTKEISHKEENHAEVIKYDKEVSLPGASENKYVESNIIINLVEDAMRDIETAH